MLEFGVEVTTAELVAVERALRGLGTDAARSALAKAHRVPVALVPGEREAVLSALGMVLEGGAGDEWKGLARLNAKLQHEQETELDAPPAPPKPRSTRKS
jgi:hypothetical protein